jgi:molybdopterin-guanine dinucleotide biosynthesis protein A
MTPGQPDRAPGGPRLTGAILAGGFSRRLGQDKAALQLGGKPLALWVHDALAPLVADCWLITNQPLAHLGFGLPLMTDLRPFQGPAGGLLTALFSARTPWVLAAAVDNPFWPRPSWPQWRPGFATPPARRWCAGLPGSGADSGSIPFASCLPYKISSRPTAAPPVSWSLPAPVLSETEVFALDPESRSFFNLNTPGDLNRAENWLTGIGSLQDSSTRAGNTGSNSGG